MLSRRHVLIGSACTIFAAPARTETAGDGFIVLRATATGYGSTVPGPVIRVRRGDEVKVRLINERDQPTSIVWHGVRLPSAMDTAMGPRPAAPGTSLDYRFTVPDAGTFWYRSTRQREQERGLYGALIVEEQVPPPVDRDQLLMFANRPGEVQNFTLNGASPFDIPARTNERLRLRFVNASTAPMDARVAGHRVMVMALDGEPAEPFPSRDSRIALGPGNRADVFVDTTLAPGSIAPIVLMHPGGEVQLARIVYEGSPARAAPLGEPAPLPPNPLPEQMNFSRALRVTLALGAGAGAPGSALFTAERGRTVVMALDNRAPEAQVVHLHGHHYRLLDRLDDGWKPYWLDTLVVAGRQTARIAFVADNPGRWPIEHRALGGAAAGGESWFQVK